MPTYARQAITFTHGEGAWLWDDQGARYLDALAGIAVCNLGHAHPAVRDAICRQSGLLIHTSNLYQVALQSRLADKLTRLSGMDNAFFCNSGAEANEAAIKLARKYGHQRGIDRPLIATAHSSFHGRTMATLSATGNPKIQQGFAPLVQGFVHAPYNDVNAMAELAHDNPNLVAILVEPAQGEGGVNLPDADYLNRLRELCDQRQLLLMTDEIQTGVGRTGRFLAYQHNAILPDVCTMAKALGNGVPIGACLARGAAAEILTAGSHGSTFGGNPLACSAALAVLETLENSDLIAQAADKGAYFCRLLQSGLAGHAAVVDIRHFGLMIGVTLSEPCAALVAKALAKGVLINVTADRVVRLLPPLVIDHAQLELLAQTLTELIQENFQ